MSHEETRSLRVGISACLLGERVRYDGGHKRDAFLTEELGQHVEWVPVCPEVELGLGVPRPPMRLVRDPAGVSARLVVVETGDDLTGRMRAYAAWRARGLASLELDGYVFKSKSPSCGLSRVPIYETNARAADVGQGLFAAALVDALPFVAMEDEHRLARPSVRAHFVERMLAAARWRAFVRRPARVGELVAFHAAHKYALLAHSPSHYEQLGRLVAAAGRRRLDDVVTEYGRLFATAYAQRATRARHTNALEHMAGFFTRALSDDQRAELTIVVAEYRRGAAPLAEPLALMREHVHRLGVAYLAEQVYLQPPTIVPAAARGA